MENYLDDIIDDIENEKCVLIIGPDLLDFGEKSFFQMMCDDFFNNDKGVLDNASEYAFLNEELLQLKAGTSETKAAKMMKRFYQKQTIFDAPLEKISQIPFPLIISLMPDDRLRKTFDKQGFPYHFDYFPIKKQMQQVAGKPTSKTPLIYNLLGDITQDDDNYYDVVLTFDDMFRFLSLVMKDGLPVNIDSCLKKTRTFIFLGVHFERWHAQLLLKIITRGGLKYTLVKNGYNSDVSLFVGRRLQLELDLLGNDPGHFLNKLYDACKEREILRQPPPPIPTVFISYNHLDKAAVHTLTSALTSNQINVIIDETEMLVGQNIEEFILKIEAVDCFIPIISINSLSSPYVIKEINTSMHMKKKILPYYLDNALNEDRINDIKKDLVDYNLDKIATMIGQNIKGKLDNLLSDREKWTEYDAHFHSVVNELKRIKGRLINIDEIDKIIKVITKDIELKISE